TLHEPAQSRGRVQDVERVPGVAPELPPQRGSGGSPYIHQRTGLPFAELGASAAGCSRGRTGMEDLAPFTGHPFIGDNAPAHRRWEDGDSTQAKRPGRGTSPGLQNTRNRLEKSLSGKKIGNQTSNDFVVPFAADPRFYKGSTDLIRNLG